MRYDPENPPDPASWLKLDEEQQVELVLQHHRRSRREFKSLPNPQLHAVMHVIVENQAALGAGTPVQDTLQRLLAEGLDRHDAIHAIGSVLAVHLFDLASESLTTTFDETVYADELAQLTAKSWRSGM